MTGHYSNKYFLLFTIAARASD